MSLYAKYLAERTDKKILETEKGFATYYYVNDGCWIEDLFVLPDFRHEHVASQIADEIALKAKEDGCKYLYGTICPTAKNSTDGLKVLLAYGFKLDSCINNFIAFKKEL